MTSEIKTAIFVKSSSKLSQCPNDDKIEIAFIGRSNVWKSSLINMLTNNNKLAKSSKKPWKTQLINHFLINNERYLVDLPWYWYSKVSDILKKKRLDMIQEYIEKSKQLKIVFVLIDSRIKPQKIDIEFIKELFESNIKFNIVFTKLDKISQKDSSKNIKLFTNELTKYWISVEKIFKTSSKTKKWRDELVRYIVSELV